jgi:hypothetical protein
VKLSIEIGDMGIVFQIMECALDLLETYR